MPGRILIVTIAALVLVFEPGAAMAYIGPGVATGAIAAVLGVIGSIFLAIFAVLYYPVKRMLKRRRKAAGSGSPQPPATGKTPGA